MRRLRTEWASTPVYLLTPIHRGYATFGPTNVQPDESFSNGLGLYIDDYVAAVKEAGNVWAATCAAASPFPARWGAMPPSRSTRPPKPALDAYRAFIAHRPAGSVQRAVPLRDPETGVYRSEWTRPDGTVGGVRWKPGEIESPVFY